MVAGSSVIFFTAASRVSDLVPRTNSENRNPVSPNVENEPTWAPPSDAPTCTYGWARRSPTTGELLWPIDSRMNHVPRSSSSARSTTVSPLDAPRSRAISSMLRPIEVVVALVARRRAPRSRRRRGRRRAAWRASPSRRSAPARRSVTAASFSARSRIDATFHHAGMLSSIRLRWSSVKLMSIGRVCTCGHTAAPRARAVSTAPMIRFTPWLLASEWNSGDSVVVMPWRSDRSASCSMRAMVSSVS